MSFRTAVEADLDFYYLLDLLGLREVILQEMSYDLDESALENYEALQVCG